MTMRGIILRDEDDLLLVRLLVENDAGAADFRPVPAVSDRDDGAMPAGSRASPPVADVLEVHNGESVRHECHDLARVERRSPPNATTPSWPPAR